MPLLVEYRNFFFKSREEKLALYSKQEPTTLKQDKFVAEYLGANNVCLIAIIHIVIERYKWVESKDFKHEYISDKEKTLLGNMVTANNTQEESVRNSFIPIDIIPIKPIILLSNYGKNIPTDGKSSARKRYLTEQEETITSTNNELES
ncbi:11760_t:CDS:1, partial [Dentiscutata heterogama]